MIGNTNVRLSFRKIIHYHVISPLILSTCTIAYLHQLYKCSVSTLKPHYYSSCYPEAWFNIKMLPYKSSRDPYFGDKTVLRSSDIGNGISHSGETTSLYWIILNIHIVATRIEIWDNYITYELLRMSQTHHPNPCSTIDRCGSLACQVLSSSTTMGWERTTL